MRSAALLLVALLPSKCSKDPVCMETYEDFTPAGDQNRKSCDHPEHRIETEEIKDGSYVRRVKVICRCGMGGSS